MDLEGSEKFLIICRIQAARPAGESFSRYERVRGAAGMLLGVRARCLEESRHLLLRSHFGIGQLLPRSQVRSIGKGNFIQMQSQDMTWIP